MAKRSLEDNLASGLLSVYNVAKLCDVSAPTVYRWLNNGLRYHRISECERRITAPDLKEFLVARSLPISKKLEGAIIAFRLRYTDSLTLKQQ